MNSTLYRDIVYTEYMLEHDLTYTQMLERVHVDEMLKRVAHLEWQDDQRAAWMSGDSPQYTVPKTVHSDNVALIGHGESPCVKGYQSM